MKRFFTVLLLLAVLLSLSGCVNPYSKEDTSLPTDHNQFQANIPADETGNAESVFGGLDLNGQNETENAGEPLGGGDLNEPNSGIPLNEWKAPDNSLTLKIPSGWTAEEKQVDNCTVNWSVTDPTGTKIAYMNNQIMVLKSEQARQIYKTYGLQGADALPVSGYLLPEPAIVQIVAPLGNSSGVQITGRDAPMTEEFFKAVCFSGLAACDALVFDATYENQGANRTGKYFVQTFDMGDGTTWWINVWGYTSKTGDWEQSKDLLEQIFSSVQYTDSWSSKCQQNTGSATTVINEVIQKRQESMDNIVQQWNNT
ncbi:MAG: hypothetical protein V1777_01805 [Candidatus Micrarchaeota archaeon]